MTILELALELDFMESARRRRRLGIIVAFFGDLRLEFCVRHDGGGVKREEFRDWP